MNIIKGIPYNPKWVNRAETKNIILHHAEALACTIQDIDKWHRANKWLGVGYHFLVRKDGNIYEGRPLEIEGSHALSYNHDSVGICFEGNFEVETMPLEQQKAGLDLIDYIQGIYGRKLKIFRHKDINVTECPGKYFPDSIIFESLKEKEEVDFEIALKLLLEKGIINNDEYWRMCNLTTKFIDKLFISFGQYLIKKGV